MTPINSEFKEMCYKKISQKVKMVIFDILYCIDMIKAKFIKQNKD